MHDDGRISCNCESFMTDGYCINSLVFGLVESSITPHLHCWATISVSWGDIQAGWKQRMGKTLFQGLDEEHHSKNMHTRHLPPQDTAFSHVSKIHSIPTAFIHNDSEGSRSLGLYLQLQGGLAMVNEPMPKHRSKLMVGDVVLKIGDTVIANDDGTLVPEMSNIAGITALI